MSQLFVNEINPYTGSTVVINGVTIDNNVISVTTISATTYQNLPTDIRVTGGTYSNGTATFNNNTGGTFNVTGFTTNGGSQFLNITYSGLVSAITGSTLSAGTYYLITDFRSCYDQPDFNSNGTAITTGNYKQAAIEPIMVFATSANTISTTAYQPAYPNDRIQYDWTFSTTEITSGVAYGRISERIDEFNNRTDYDHRTILFKRYKLFTFRPNQPLNGTIQLFNNGIISGTSTSFTTLTVGDVVYIPSTSPSYYEIVSITGNTAMTVSGDTITAIGAGQQIFPTILETNDSNGYFSYKRTNVKTNDFIEYTTFGDAISNDYAKNTYVGNFANNYQNVGSGFILANNVFLEGAYESNKFGDYCYNNTFGTDNQNNVWGDYCYENVSTNDIDDNIIGHYFNNNLINVNLTSNQINNYFNNNKLLAENSEDFYANIIGNSFNNNTIYSWFYTNEILDDFNNNIIGAFDELTNFNFYGNSIGNNFSENIITNNFYKNKIGYGFNDNQISGETYTNIIGEQFENNTIYGEFYDNQIFNEFKGNITYQSFTENIVDFGFASNQISGFCSDNSFGTDIVSNDFLGSVFGNIFKGSVYGNIIGDNFSTNNIGFGFISNTIGEGFGYGASAPQGNIIGNGFIDNTIGEYFYNNSIPDNFHDNEIGNYFQWNVINTNIDYTNFTLNYGNITGFSYTTIGNTATDGIYTNLSATTNGGGTAATFNVEVSGGTVISFSGNTEGRLYSSSDTLTILGTQIDGVTTSGGIIYGFSSDGIGKNGSYGVYTNLPATGGTGTDATFNVSVSTTFNLVYEITLNNPGSGYTLNDELVIVGSLFDGTDGIDDITITINSLYSDDVTITVTGVTSASLFYENYTKQIFKRRLGDKRILFYDEDDVLNIDSVYISSGYIPVYSQNLTFPYTYTSFNFLCDGGYVNGGGTTNQTVTNSQELVTLFNINFRQFGYFFDNNDGKIGLYIDPILKQINCPSGTYTINVFND